MAEDALERRRAFTADAPRRRAELVAELSACVAAASTLEADEAAVLRHVFSYAGFTEAGDLRVPALAPLWGEGVSYVPAVRLPSERVRAAARLLVRRGVLRGVDDEVAVDATALRDLALPVKPKKARVARRKPKAGRASSRR